MQHRRVTLNTMNGVVDYCVWYLVFLPIQSGVAQGYNFSVGFYHTKSFMLYTVHAIYFIFLGKNEMYNKML